MARRDDVAEGVKQAGDRVSEQAGDFVEGFQSQTQKPGSVANLVTQKIPEAISQKSREPLREAANEGIVKPIVNLGTAIMEDYIKPINKALTTRADIYRAKEDFFKDQENKKIYEPFAKYSSFDGTPTDDSFAGLQSAKADYDRMKAVMNDPTKSQAQKDAEIAGINVSYQESLKKLKKIPTPEEAEQLFTAMDPLVNKINQEVEKSAVVNNYTANKVQVFSDNIDKGIDMQTWITNKQGKLFNGKPLTWTDIGYYKNALINEPNARKIIERPYEVQKEAEDAMKKLKEGTTNWKIAKQAYDKATQLIQENNDELLPYMTYFINNMGGTGFDTSEKIIKQYKKQTGKDYYTIFAADKGETLGDSLIVKQATTLNRADIADTIGSMVKYAEGTPGQKIMEVGGYIGRQLLQAADKTWSALYRGFAHNTELSYLDMTTFENLDSALSKTNTEQVQKIKNFLNTVQQVGPEFVGTMYLTNKMNAALIFEDYFAARNIGRLGKEATTAAEYLTNTTAGLVKAEDKIGPVLETLAKLPQKAKEANDRVKNGMSLMEAAKKVAPGDIVLQKWILNPTRAMMTNYGISAMLQGYNPKQYSTADFFMDTVGVFADTLIDAAKIANSRAAGLISDRNAVISEFSKKRFGLGEDERLKLPTKDKKKFDAGSRLIMVNYNKKLDEFSKAGHLNDMQGFVKTISNWYDSRPWQQKVIKGILNPESYKSMAIAGAIADGIPEGEYIKAVKAIKGDSKTRTPDLIKKLEDELLSMNESVGDTLIPDIVDDINETDMLRNVMTQPPSSQLGMEGWIDVDGERMHYKYIGDSKTKKYDHESFVLLQQDETYKKVPGKVIGDIYKNGKNMGEAPADRLLRFHKRYNERFWGTRADEDTGRQVGRLKYTVKKSPTMVPVETYNEDGARIGWYYFGGAPAFKNTNEVEKVIHDKGRIYITDRNGVETPYFYVATKINPGEGKTLAYIKNKKGIMVPWKESIDNTRYRIEIPENNSVITIFNNANNKGEFRIGVGEQSAKILNLMKDDGSQLANMPNITFKITSGRKTPESVFPRTIAWSKGVPNRPVTEGEVDVLIQKWGNNLERIGVTVDKQSLGQLIEDNPSILGAYFYKDRLIKLPNPQQGTFEHELIHAWFDRATDQKTRDSVITYIMNDKSFLKQYPNGTIQDAEEYLADNFFNYLKGKPQTVGGKIKQYFRDIVDRLTGRVNQMKKYYKDVEAGKIRREAKPQTYKGMTITYGKIDGVTGGRRIGNEMMLDLDLLHQKYKEKARTNPRVPGVRALPEDEFKTFEDRVDFVKEHEYQHTQRTIRPGESKGDYENAVNDLALLNYKPVKYSAGPGKQMHDTKILAQKKFVKHLYQLEDVAKAYADSRGYKNFNTAIMKNDITTAKNVGVNKYIISDTNVSPSDQMSVYKAVLDPLVLNTDRYSQYDMVMVFADGKHPDMMEPNFDEISKAIDGRSTIITKPQGTDLGTRGHPFNYGDQEVAKYLEESGYIEQGRSGVWKHPDTRDFDNSIIEQTKKINAQTELDFSDKICAR